MNLFTVLFMALTATVPLQNFTNFMSNYNKSYDSFREMAYRYAVYSENVGLIQEHNAVNASYSLAENQFADWTSEEFMDLFHPLTSDACTDPSAPKMMPVPVPAEVDWRKKGIVTPVKNQASCGSCWAFSTTGSLEGMHALKTGQLVSLSEQQLVDCAQAFGNNGCEGGLMSRAFEYIHYNGGIEAEESYPYTAKDGTCLFNPAKVAATVASSVNITEGDLHGLEQAVAFQGPIGVAVQVNFCWQFYAGGIFNMTGTFGPTRCTGGTPCSSAPDDLNHGVLLVGYGHEDSGTDYCQVEGGCDYWLIKNSWGPGWGEGGYIKMAKSLTENLCGIATCASYPVV